MNSTILFAIGMILVLALVIFFLASITKRQRIKQQAKEMALFTKTAKQKGMHINHQERLEERIIGADDALAKLLFIDFGKEPKQVTSVDLLQLSEAKLISDKTVMGESGEQFVSSLHLRLSSKDKSAKPILLNFYEYGVNPIDQFKHLEERGMTWKKTIDRFIGI